MWLDKILVIGATGHVGSQLVPLLAQRGETVKAATRHPDAYQVSSAQVEPVFFDYDQPDRFAEVLQDVDRLFMLALPADPLTVTRLTPLVDAAKRAHVQHIVMMTAIGVENADGTPLREVEKHIEASGVAYTFLRPNWFMDNFSSGFIQPMIAEAKSVFVPAEDAKTSFIATKDIAAVAAVVLTELGHRGKEYTLTGDEALTYAEAAQILSEANNETIQYVPISDEALRQNMSQTGLGDEEVDYFSMLFQSVRAGFTERIDTAVSQLLQQKPITFKEFASNHPIL